MASETNTGQVTRMLFLGDESLADGFRMIGFETHPDPSHEEVDQLFQDLIRRGDKAFAIVDETLMQAKIPGLERVRAEGAVSYTHLDVYKRQLQHHCPPGPGGL